VTVHRTEPPTAAWQAVSPLGAELVIPRTGDRILFDASSSSAATGRIVEYAWDWSSDGSFDEVVAYPLKAQAFSSAGSHEVTLRVTDDEGATDTITKTLTILSAEASVRIDEISNALAFSPDGSILASGSFVDRVRLWDASAWALLRTLSGHTNAAANSVAFSPDGSTLASGSHDDTIRLWDLSSGTLLRTLSGHTESISSVAFSSDGEILASGSHDDTIKLWDASRGRLLRTLNGHTNNVYSVAFALDSSVLASGSADDTIKLWDGQTGELLCTLSGHTKDVHSVAFSSDGGILASGSRDGTVILWDVDAILHPNEPPTASFTWQALSVSGTRLVVEPRTGDRLRFDASGSSDPDGEIVEYAWDWDSNGSYAITTSDSVIEHAFTFSGSHRVTLRVTDNDGATDTLIQTITIGESQPPNAAFTFAPSSPSILDTVQFTDNSSDPDGSISSWRWDFGDGLSSTERNPSHRYSEKGTFTVQLTVTDNDDLTDSVTMTLTIKNLLPEARFSYEPEEPLLQQPVRFDGGTSDDADGEILSYRWDFDGDGTTDEEGITVTWTFTEPGEYEVTLEISDDDQGTSSTSQQVTVGEAPPESPRFSNLWGIVIGVSGYQDSRLSDLLGLPENDARAVYEFLVDRQGGGFPENQVRLLLNEDATKSAIEQAWGWLLRQAGEEDLVVVYFSGHGGHDDDYNGDEPEGDSQDEYLLPYDTNVSDMFSTAIRDDTVGDWVRSLRSKSVILIFDSCHSGGAARSARGYEPPGSRAGPGNTLFTDLTGEGLLVMAACQAVEVAQQDNSLGYGVFTYYLLSGLGGLEKVGEPAADTDGDGRVSVDELSEYLECEVPEHVSGMMPPRSPQNPLISGDDRLNRVALSGYGVPLVGDVITVQDDRVLVPLGSRHGVQVGDHFEVVYVHVLPDDSTIDEVRAVIEVLYVLAADRSTCRVVDVFHPIEVEDRVRPVREREDGPDGTGTTAGPARKS